MRRALPWIALLVMAAGVVMALAIPSVHHVVPSRVSLPATETDDRLWIRLAILGGALLLGLFVAYWAGRRDSSMR